MIPTIPLPTFDTKWLTPQEFARVMNVNVETVRRWTGKREVRAFKMGRTLRYDPTSVIEFIFRHTLISKSPRRPLPVLSGAPLPKGQFDELVTKLARLAVELAGTNGKPAGNGENDEA